MVRLEPFVQTRQSLVSKLPTNKLDTYKITFTNQNGKLTHQTNNLDRKRLESTFRVCVRFACAAFKQEIYLHFITETLLVQTHITSKIL